MSRIVANTAKDTLRRRRRRREGPFFEAEAPGRTPEDLAQEKQMLVLLREMVSLLPDTYREVIELRVYEGLSTRQTADLLHVSRSDVSTRLCRATKLLQQHIDARL